MILSTRGRTALAFGTVVMMRSCSITLVTSPLNSDLRAATLRLSLYPATLCLIDLFRGKLFRRFVQVFVALDRTGVGLRTARRRDQAALSIELHAKAQAEVAQDFLDLIQRLATEVLGAQHFGFGLLHQVADGLNIGVLQAVVGTHAELELFDGAVENLVHLVHGALAGLFDGLRQLFEVDEDRHVVFEELGGLTDGILRRDGAVGPHFDGQLVVIGVLAEARRFNGEVDFAYRRMDRIDGDVAERQVLVEIAVGRHVAASALEAHFDVELSGFADRRDVHVAVEHFDIGVCFDLAAHDFTGLVDFQANRARALPDHLERDLLEIEDDVGGVLDDAGNGAEFVRDAIDAHGGDGRAFDGAEQHAAQAGADG